MLLGIDFDLTINNNLDIQDGDRFSKPMAHVKEAFTHLKSKGHKILIHSCNRKKWIEEWMAHWDIPYDYIWDGVGKPNCDWFIDDRAIHFDGDWMNMLNKIGGQISK